MNARRTAVAIGLTLAATAACGESRVVLDTGRGLLDCPSGTYQTAVADYPSDVLGAPTPEEARPTGTPAVSGTRVLESRGESGVVFVFLDGDGNRVGRIGVARAGGGGWVTSWTQACG